MRIQYKIPLTWFFLLFLVGCSPNTRITLTPIGHIGATPLFAPEHNIVLLLSSFEDPLTPFKIGNTLSFVGENLSSDEILIEFGNVFSVYIKSPTGNSLELIQDNVQQNSNQQIILGPAGSETDSVILFTTPAFVNNQIPIDLFVVAKGLVVVDGNVTDQEVIGSTNIQLQP